MSRYTKEQVQNNLHVDGLGDSMSVKLVCNWFVSCDLYTAEGKGREMDRDA